MCKYCEEEKTLLKHEPSTYDPSEAIIKKNFYNPNMMVIELAIANGEKICNKPVRNCYEIKIDYCPKCGKKFE